jgi:hypothetical protein
VLGPEHPDTATSLNNLAQVLAAQGNLLGARPLYERTLAIRERALGPEHPDTATSLHDLGLLLKDQGDLARARPLLERALAIWEKVQGSEHPNTAAASTASPFCCVIRVSWPKRNSTSAGQSPPAKQCLVLNIPMLRRV